MSTQTSTAVPTRPGGNTAPTVSPQKQHRHPSRTVLAVTTSVAAVAGVAALWISLAAGSGTQDPATPGVENFVSEVPPGIDGSDAGLYLRAHEQPAGQVSADGSDRHLYYRQGR